MLSKTDFAEKQVLFIYGSSDFDNKLKFENSNLTLYRDGKPANRISAHKLISLFVMGNFSTTNVLIEKFLRNGISIFMLDFNLKQYAQIGSEAEGNYILRHKQYSLSTAQSLEISKKLVSAKIRNQLFLLKKFKKINRKKYLEMKKGYFLKIKKAKDKKTLLGLEGNCSRFYFKLLFKEFDWYRRLPRTKVDITNLLMDIGYTFLFNLVDSFLGLYGFDKYKGVYHDLFFQRKSLSCDLVEPFRPLIDEQIVKSYHLNQINNKEFKKDQTRFFIRRGFNKKYCEIFLKALLHDKMSIFEYIKGFYRFMMDPKKNDFPIFKLR